MYILLEDPTSEPLRGKQRSIIIELNGFLKIMGRGPKLAPVFRVTPSS